MGSSGFPGDLAGSTGGGSPAPAQLHCWGLPGWAAAVPTPVSDAGQTELRNRDAQTDTRRQKNQVEPESGKDRETKIDSGNEKSKIARIDCLLCARNCASHCHLLLYWSLLTTLPKRRVSQCLH